MSKLTPLAWLTLCLASNRGAVRVTCVRSGWEKNIKWRSLRRFFNKGRQKMGDELTCVCGHTEDEHGGDPQYPGSSKCNVDDCECVCFEADEDEDDGDA